MCGQVGSGRVCVGASGVCAGGHVCVGASGVCVGGHVCECVSRQAGVWMGMRARR